VPTAYAPDSYTSGAAQTDFTITFPYLRASHLTVTDDGVDVTTAEYTLVTGGTVVRFNTAPATSSAIVISRVTPKGADFRLNDYVAGAGVSETELDEADQQLHYALEELEYNTSAAGLAAALATASASADAAETAETNAETAETNAETAETNAETAQTAAEAAQAAAEAAALTATLMRNYRSGFTLVRTSSTVITVGDGVAMDSTNAEMIDLAASATIDLTVSGVGGLGVARPSGAEDWIHVFAVKRTTGGTVYVYGDTSVTAANKPGAGDAGTHRRVGSFYVNADVPGITVLFTQFGDETLWDVPVTELSDVALSTTAALRVCRVPTDVKVRHIGDWSGNELGTGGSVAHVLVTSPDQADTTATAQRATLSWWNGAANGNASACRAVTRTDTSAQVRYVAAATDANHDLSMVTHGWIDDRGANG
jgi:hypothetical protein